MMGSSLWHIFYRSRRVGATSGMSVVGSVAFLVASNGTTILLDDKLAGFTETKGFALCGRSLRNPGHLKVAVFTSEAQVPSEMCGIRMRWGDLKGEEWLKMEISLLQRCLLRDLQRGSTYGGGSYSRGEKRRASRETGLSKTVHERLQGVEC